MTQPGLVPQPGGVPPPTAPALPELPSVTAVPGPTFGGKDDNGVPGGDMMGFGEFGGRGGMGGFGGMAAFDSLRYSEIWFPNVPVRGQATQFQMVGEDLSFAHPLWADPLNTLSLSGGVGNRLIQTGALLPDTGQAFPADLWNVHLGLRYARQLNDGWVAGGGVSVGSASDHPFATIHEMNFGVNAMLRIPQGEHNAWIFSLMYAPTSELNFPLPGVAFSYNPSPEFHANIGLPLMVIWRPSEQWQFQASYMLLRTVHVRATWRFAPQLSAFAAYDYCNEAYTLLDRPEENDRFFMYDQRVSLGLQSAFTRHWTASLSAGYVFSRYAFEGTSSTASGFDRLDFGNGPFVSVTLGARY
jgi:hypothetical protein